MALTLGSTFNSGPLGKKTPANPKAPRAFKPPSEENFSYSPERIQSLPPQPTFWGNLPFLDPRLSSHLKGVRILSQAPHLLYPQISPPSFYTIPWARGLLLQLWAGSFLSHGDIFTLPFPPFLAGSSTPSFRSRFQSSLFSSPGGIIPPFPRVFLL